jgi:hypothetical protein
MNGPIQAHTVLLSRGTLTDWVRADDSGCLYMQSSRLQFPRIQNRQTALGRSVAGGTSGGTAGGMIAGGAVTGETLTEGTKAGDVATRDFRAVEGGRHMRTKVAGGVACS